MAGLVWTLFGSAALGAQPSSEITVITQSGPRSIPISRFDGTEMVPLELLGSLVGADMRSSDDGSAVNLTTDGKMARVSDGRVFVPVEGRLVALSSPARLVSGNWFVPLDFLSKVLPSVAVTSVTYRARERMLILGEEFPTLEVHARTNPSFTRIDIETSGPVPLEVTQGNDAIRVTIQAPYVQTRFENEDVLDEVVHRIALERGGASYLLTIELGERFGTLKAFEKTGREHGVVLDLLRSRVPTTAGTRDGAPEEIQEDLRSMEERAAAAEAAEPPLEEPPPGEEGEETIDYETIELPPDYETGVPRSPGLPPPSDFGPARLDIVTIDPGHGGAETGAEGNSGLVEKSLVLSIAREFRKLLQERLGLRVVLTRDGDRNLSLDERAAIANNNKSDLFVSIHADSSPRRNARGSSVYFLSYSSTDAESNRVTMAQSGSNGGGGGDLDFILWDMAQASHLSQSSRLAEILQEELLSATGTKTINRGIKQNTFRVLKGATMPAVLVEVGFISNTDEEALLGTKAYQEKLAEALFRGVVRFKELYESQAYSETASRGQR